ncbi:FAD-binding-3 domain-containing protein [Mycena indigotica]|uniref:FAD-binding-3 domain-containing protein n=1 Tax=Mycena indigotica TaxID=2126181 RepID=A0A8H6T0D6_9AGAR|nr:FAD-binding-3 domain-containing protein [Mycena indigotica]KAF7309373.1 FAD-binding-3 domain-containing protein [Mycena indigotica]
MTTTTSSMQTHAPLGSTLRIAIVGGGMGGLATALGLARNGFTHITVYEAAKDLGFVGAGIQVAPNLARQLQRLGVWEHLATDAVKLESADVRACASNEVLVRVPLAHVTERYGQPHRVAHRSALANALFQGCREAASYVTVHFNTNVLDVDFGDPRILVKERGEPGNGRWVKADIIIGADGIKSVIRKQMLAKHGEEDRAQDTGQASYRIMLNRTQMQDDPELLALVDANSSFRWIGPRRHVIAYPISDHTIFNISTTQPDINFAAAPTATYTTRADKQAMLNVFQDFCDVVQRMLKMVPEGEVCEWKLRVHSPLETWVEGKVVLLGDACHPTLPHLGQGASQAIEDAAVISVVLSRIDDPADINIALRIYQRLRKSRTEFLVSQAAAAGRALHLTDPEAQALRDEAFRQVANGGPNPDKWLDRQVQDFVYGFDCVADAERQWVKLFAQEKSSANERSV